MSFSSSLNTRGLSKQPACIPILPALSVPSDLFFSILDNVSSDLFFGMERVIASCLLDRCDVLWDEPEFLAGSTELGCFHIIFFFIFFSFFTLSRLSSQNGHK